MVLVWKPITDLPEDWASLTGGELKPLLQFWNDQRTDLEQSAALTTFTQRLNREWSIETGQIEGVYNIDRGVTRTLIERGINADLIPRYPGQKPPELIAAIIQDHAEVLEGLFQFVKGDRLLSKSYVHELHAALLKHQETTLAMDQFGNLFEAKLEKGKYKQRPNNPKRADGSTHRYCPPEQVEPEMERLLAMHTEHERQGVPVEIEAAWLHHRFTQIHPYQDGNGRVARALASLLLVKAGWFPMVVTRDDRLHYIDALEVADQGDLRPLVSFMAHIQKRALFETLQNAADSRQVQSVDDAIDAAKRVLTGLGKESDPEVWLKAKKTAERLMDHANLRLAELTKKFTEEIGETGAALQFSNSRSDRILPAGLDLGYKPNAEYSDGCSLRIENIHQGSINFIGVHAHGIGSKFRGLIGMIAYHSAGKKIELASADPFQISYAELFESADRRFQPWLEESLVNALNLWRKSL